MGRFRGYLMASGAFWLGANQGVNNLGNQMLVGPALASKAYSSELKGQAETSLLMQKLRETAVDAEKKLIEKGILEGAPGHYRMSAAANAGTTLPDIEKAERYLTSGDNTVGMTGGLDQQDYYRPDPRAMRAVSEYRGASANPERNTLSTIGGYRENMAEMPGKQAKSDAITAALDGIQAGDWEGVRNRVSAIEGRYPPKEAADEATTAVRTLQALLKQAGVVEGSPDWIKAHRDLYKKQTTHAPSTNVNVMPASNEWVQGPDGKWFKWRLGKSGQQELAPVPEGYNPASPTEDPLNAIIRGRTKPGGAAPAKDPAAAKTDPKALAIRADLRAGKLTREQAKQQLQALGYSD